MASGRLFWVGGVIAVVFGLSARAHAGLCEDLSAQKHGGTWAVAPLDCARGIEGACAELAQQVVTCVRGAGVDVMAPGALTAAVDEAALRAVLGSGDMREVRKVGALVPAQFLVIGEVSKREGGAAAVLRVVRLEDGRIVTGSRLQLSDAGVIEAQLEDKHKLKQGELKEETVEVGLRLLADRLAEGLEKVSGNARYKRVAVLDFSANGGRVAELGLGRLVPAELMTRFARDHQLILVERARLDRVLGEHALAQQGVVDAAHAPELGKMVEADLMVLGSVSEAGAAYLVHAQVIEVETALTVVAESVSLQAAGLVTLASDAVVLRTRAGAVYRSLLIPGWGQHYNRETNKAMAFSVAGGTLALGAIGSQILYSMTRSEYDQARPGDDFDAMASRAERYQLSRNLSLALLAITWGYNVLDAYISGADFDSALVGGAGAARATP